MKTTNTPARLICAAGITAALLAMTAPLHAGLQIPYTNDAFTLHLWHFDGATNTTVTTDEVATASINLTSVAQTNVPGTTIALGAPSALGALNTALHIIPTNLSTGTAFAFAVATNSATTNGGFDPTNFRDAGTGAFTIEALIKPEGNPFVANGNWEIVCGDNTGNNGLTRGWQFRIQTAAAPTLNFNFITGGTINQSPVLPNSGPDALVQGQWYHVAVTFTGNTPTNGDATNVLTFYWTLVDAGRTNATVLASFSNGNVNSIGGTPVLGIGGSARNYPATVANGEGFKGAIDEVRISSVCRKSNEMAFVTGGALSPPVFLAQPPASTFIGFGKTLTLPALVTGSPAPVFIWKQNGTVVPGQTNSTLIISNVDFTNAGAWQLIASNSVNFSNSVIANVAVGAAFNELYATGVDSNSAVAAAGSGDLHYVLAHSADINNLGPNSVVWNMAAFPIAANGGNFANPDGASAWIGTQANSYSSPVGSYTYRTTFLLDSVDLAQPTELDGTWYVNEIGNDVLLNGVSTGNSISSVASSSGKFSFNFTITNGFLPGLNTLDFVTTRSAGANGSYQESAVRVEMAGIGQALSPAKPVIATQPANLSVRDGGNSVTFSVVATGRPPLSYQWVADGTPIGGATNRSLFFTNASTGAQGTNFMCVVSNTSGATNSTVGKLTLVPGNQALIVPSYTNTIVSNATLNVDLSTIYQACVDPDGDGIYFFMADGASTNGGTVVQNGTILTYTPPGGFLGTDGFTATFGDLGGSLVPSSIVVNVVAATPPTITSATVAGGNFIFSGTGGPANAGYTVVSSTNITTPLTNWVVIGTGTFNGGGNFSFTNAVSPAPSQRYYILRLP